MRLLTALLAILLATPAFATTRYLNKSGSDANSCATSTSATDANAKLTFTSAIACMAAGDILSIGPGTYVEAINDTIPSGSSGSPTTLIAETPNTVIMSPTTGALSNFVLYINGNSWITIDGIDMNCGNVSHSQCEAVYIDGSSAGHYVFQNGTLRNGKGYLGSGIEIENAVSDNSIINMDIYDNALDDGTGGFGHGMYISSSNNLIERNRVRGGSGYGIHVYNAFASSANNIIRFNTVYGNGFIGGRGGMLVVGAGNVIHHNIVYSNYTGIELYSGCDTCLAYFNTIYGNSNAGFNIYAGASNSNVRDNVLYNNGNDVVINSGSGSTVSFNTTADPSFVINGVDFHLKPTSTIIGDGVTIAAYNTDFDGVTHATPPTPGAYEAPSGSDPSGPIVETFTYTPTTPLNGLNGGTGWTQTWQVTDGAPTIETTSCLTGTALRTTATSFVEARRFFTAQTGVFTIQAKMCLDTTSQNDLIGISLIGNDGGYKIAVWFTAAGNLLLYDNGSMGTLSSYSANTPYRIRFNFDTVGQPNKVRMSVGDGVFTGWIDTVSAFSSITGIFVNNYATSAHTFEVDDINSEAGPPLVPPAPVNPVGIRARMRAR